jgi:2-polyprenyl-6-methoxyphenol hydroxylase-like FAD-dependent oxidoreductase
MFHSVPVEEQYSDIPAGGLRVLVSGAGVAGVTAAQLLRLQGVRPVLVERAADAHTAGYMLALMPMADSAIDELGVRDLYRASSVPIRRYAVDGHTGRRIREDPIADFLHSFGDYRGIDRGGLIDVLTGHGTDVSTAASICAVTELGDRVRASVSSPAGVADLDFDVVVIAEGMHSATRELLGNQVGRVDTGWGGWVTWTDCDGDQDLGEEVWGAGCFAATYPVAGRLGIFLGGPRTETRNGPGDFVENMRRRIVAPTPRIDHAMTAVATAEHPYFWALTDCRTRHWARGRTVLLGDAAAGFLPTAGIGAGMAMESAWVLARMLRTADRADVHEVLARFELLQRPRVTAAQRNSRQLASLMFRRSRLLAVVREAALRSVSVERALGPIQKLLRNPPSPISA